jgi:protein tyrosine/serine phosphatase
MNQSVHVARLGLAGLCVYVAAILGCDGGGLPVGVLPYNFDVLDPGVAYRSSQPTGDQLDTIIARYDIRTVLNLRGENPGKSWYDDEAAVCAARGVTLVSGPMSAQALPPADVLAGVVDALQTAEYPMLIHCNAGADRTGAVSAIYRMLILGDDRAAALAELSPQHLHFQAYAPCMDTLAELYEPTSDWLDWYAANADQISCP